MPYKCFDPGINSLHAVKTNINVEKIGTAKSRLLSHVMSYRNLCHEVTKNNSYLLIVCANINVISYLLIRLIYVPLQSIRTKVDSRSFRVAQNSLSLHLRSPTISRDQFRVGLKSHVFKCAYTSLYLRELLRSELTNLLTYLLIVLSYFHRSTSFVELSPVSTSRVDEPCSTRLVETRARFNESTRPVLTGNGNRSPVNSGRQLG